MSSLDFPGGPVVKNPPASARDVGSIPGPGRVHVLWGQLSLCAGTTEACTPEPVLSSKSGRRSEKPKEHNEGE